MLQSHEGHQAHLVGSVIPAFQFFLRHFGNNLFVVAFICRIDVIVSEVEIVEGIKQIFFKRCIDLVELLIVRLKQMCQNEQSLFFALNVH